MVFEIQTRGFTLTSALADMIEMRANAITANWRNQLTRMDITLSDANGPKGGIDKICKVRCQMAGSETLFAESIAADMYEAIHNCFDKIKRRINKKRKKFLGKQQRKKVPTLAQWPVDTEELAYEPFDQDYVLGHHQATENAYAKTSQSY